VHPSEQTTRHPHAAVVTRPGQPSGRRYQHKLDTLAALRHAALRLALTHGLEAITAAEIAEAAGVSRRTFFNYFASTEDALVGETPQLSEHLRVAIAARPTGESPLAAVRAALTETAAAMVTDDVRDRIHARHQLLTVHPELLGRHLARYAAFEGLLTEAIAARRDTDTDPELLATLIAGAVRLCAHRWAEHGDPSLSQRLHTALATLHSGMP
jgi:AcrR family transcriptional regulator